MPIVNVMQEHELKNAYIGEYGWKPWANTVGYRPLTTTTQWADQSWNWYDLSGSYRTFWTYAGVDCVEVSWWSNSNPRLYNANIPIWNSRTWLVWFYCTVASNNDRWVICTWHDYVNGIIGGWLTTSNNTPYVTDRYTYNAAWTWNLINSWHLMAITYDGTTAILYIDGTENTRYNWTRTSDTGIAFSHKAYSGWWSQYSERFTWYMSEAIYEDKVRTAQEVLGYYNQTKANYGL